MQELLKRINQTILHLIALDETFLRQGDFDSLVSMDIDAYKNHVEALQIELNNLNYQGLLYQKDGRQMILSDILEYIFFGRIYYGIDKEEDRGHFIKAILLFINLLMFYEDLTMSDRLRSRFLNILKEYLPDIEIENSYNELISYSGLVGISSQDQAGKDLDNYFDTLLPKTAGGMWHEFLAYTYILRSDVGYIVPLFLTQKLFSRSDHLTPPDLLIIEHKHKNIIGLEIGSMKERQSNKFMSKTGIPTISIDTRNSRTDRCPICQRWIAFCPFVINNYSDLKFEINHKEVKCLRDCNLYDIDEKSRGDCQYSKYQRTRIQAQHSHHPYSNGLHYHYQCILSNVTENTRGLIIEAQDQTAIKTHYPHYSGLEDL